jgi:cytochrome c5
MGERIHSPHPKSNPKPQNKSEAPVMSEEHGSLVKTPKQLIIVSVIALVVPVAIAVLGAQLVSGSKSIDTTESKKSVEQRIRPVGEIVKLEGAAPAPTGAVVAVAAKAKSGQEVYDSACVACHGAGVAGAPKTGDKAAWAARIAQGAAVLYDHAIKGFKGMPAKGGSTALSDDEVKAGVDFQVAKSK